jgi:hypothetical protein
MKTSSVYIIGGVLVIIIGILVSMYVIRRRTLERFDGPGPSPGPSGASGNTEVDTDTDTDTETDTDMDMDMDMDMGPDADTDDEEEDTPLKKRMSKEKGRSKRRPLPRATLEHDLDPGLKRDFAPFVLNDDEMGTRGGNRSLEAKSITNMTMKGTPMSEITPSPAPLTEDLEN